MDKLEQTKLIKERSGTDTRKCMKCGKCTGRCPAYADMDVKPHQFVSYIEKGKINELLESKSLYTCLSCFASSAVFFIAILSSKLSLSPFGIFCCFNRFSCCYHYTLLSGVL